jgi:hypothetical protein
VVQGRQAAASVRRDLQKRYERCAEVAFGGRAAGKEAGYEVAPLETVVQVRMLHHQAMQWSNSRHHRHGLMPRNSNNVCDLQCRLSGQRTQLFSCA